MRRDQRTHVWTERPQVGFQGRGDRPDTFAGCEYRSIYDVYPEESDTGWERWNRISYNILGRRTGQQNNSSGLQLGRGWQFDRYVIFAIPQGNCSSPV